MMKTIDCLLIGYNEMNFTEYEETISRMGKNSGAYRDLALNFIRYNKKPHSIVDAFNSFYCSERHNGEFIKPLDVGESFSAAIAYLGTYLHRRGFSFDYVNSFQGQKNELVRKLHENNILTVAITTTLYVSPIPILEILELVKKHNPDAAIIIGGPFISTQIRTKEPEYLDYLFNTLNADFYIDSSQGESALVNIISAIKTGQPFDTIHNIRYKTGSGYVTTPLQTEDNKLIENMVDWDLFAHNAGEYVNFRSAISCPFACSFCGFPQHAGKYQTAGVEAVESELKRLAKKENLKSVHFIDDTFNVPVKRFKEILCMLIKNKFDFKWHSYLRCQFIDEETVQLMKGSGCDGVFLGIESGSGHILENMNKAAKPEEYLKGIELLKKYGIITFGDFIIGFPGETEESVRETRKFIDSSGLDFFRTQLWYCEHITPIWKEKEKYGIQGESFEWSHRTMDSKTACNIIEDIFMTTGDPTWLPQYNFDFDTLWHLMHRGLDLDRVKRFINAFNDGVKEKLKNSSRKEIGFEVVTRLKGSGESDASDVGSPLPEIDDSEAEFDF